MKSQVLLAYVYVVCIAHLAWSAISSGSTDVGMALEAEEESEGFSRFVRNGRLEPEWRNDLSEATEDINLSDLGIETLMAGTFAKFHALHGLNLSSNKLTSTKNVVAALQHVHPLVLDLSRNNLGSPNRDWPSIYDDRSYKQNKTFLLGSKYFWSIDLSYNSLAGLGIDFEVTYLNLSNNKIRCHNGIETHRFYGDDIYVGTLDLSHNLIDCQNKFFTHYIETIDMSYNKLTGLDEGFLKGLGLLHTLNLSHNGIRYVHPRAFESTIRLRHLDLQSNQIRAIYKLVWIPVSRMRYIDLSSNRLQILDWEWVQFSSTVEVNVKNNSDLEWPVATKNIVYLID